LGRDILPFEAPEAKPVLTYFVISIGRRQVVVVGLVEANCYPIASLVFLAKMTGSVWVTLNRRYNALAKVLGLVRGDAIAIAVVPGQVILGRGVALFRRFNAPADGLALVSGDSISGICNIHELFM
jgi:hypothetical protein